MICVTGASGTLGREVVEQLRRRRVPFRASYFSSQHAETARAQGIDAVIGDYSRPETLHHAFQACDKLFLLGPNLPDQTQLELNAVAAAKGAGREESVRCFRRSAEHDPGCAMAYWGVASALGSEYNKRWDDFTDAEPPVPIICETTSRGRLV